jgi:Zn-dependent protease
MSSNAFSAISELLPPLLSILIHGGGHLLMARLCGLAVLRVRKTPTGLRLIFEGAFPSYDTELYCALGGPLANAASALFCRLCLVPRGLCSDFCATFIPLSLYWCLLNLLPLPCFDGDRILRSLLCAHHRRLPSLLPEVVDRMLNALSCLIWVVFWLLSVYLLLRRASALCLFVFCFQLFRSTAQKSEHSGVFGSI